MGLNHSSSRLPWPVLLVLAINIGLILSYVGLWIIAARDNLLWRADFSMFYTGGTMINSGLSSQLYNWDRQAIVQQELLGGRSFSQGLLPFNYPPHVAVFFSLISRLPLPQAYMVWIFFQILVVGGLVAILLRNTNHWQPVESWLLISAFLAMPGLFRSFLLGALTPLILLCVFAWYFALRHNSDSIAGGWLFLSIVKPQYTIGPGIVTLLGRRWKTIIIFSIAGILLVVSIGIKFGWNLWIDFFSNLIVSGSYFNEFGINPSAMYNLKGILTLCLGSAQADLINILSLSSFLFSLALTVWLWRGKWDVQQPAFIIRMSFTLFLSILFSLHVNLQDGLLLVAPAVLFYEYLRQRNLPRKKFAILALSCPALLLLDEFFLSNWLPIRLTVVAMVIMLVWSGKLLRQENLNSKQ